MKYISLLITLLLVGAGLPMLLPGPDGEPIMSPRDWLPAEQTLHGVKQQSESIWRVLESGGRASGERLSDLTTSGGEAPKKQGNSVYKWRDADGNWHFSDKVPEGREREVQRHQIRPLNTLPALETEPTEAVGGTEPEVIAPPLPTTISTERIPQLIEDAKALQERAIERQRALDEL